MAIMTQQRYARKIGVSHQYVGRKVKQGVIHRVGAGIDSDQADQALKDTRHLAYKVRRKGAPELQPETPKSTKPTKGTRATKGESQDGLLTFAEAQRKRGKLQSEE